MSNGEPIEPVVITKPESPFYRSPKFLVFLVIPILAGIVFASIKYLPILTRQPQEQPQQIAKPIKSLKSIVGTVEAVDSQKSTVTVNNSNGEKKSFPVSQDVLISQVVLGAKAPEGKQVSLPTTLLYIEDLASRVGEEVNLVFDEAGQIVIQIQMYSQGNKS